MKSEEKLNKDLRLLAKTSAIVFISIFLSKIFTYVYRIIIARYYGPEIYGIFILALMVIGWLGAFANFGLSSGLVRYTSILRAHNKKQEIKFLFWNTIKLGLISTFISAIILFILSKKISLGLFNEPLLIPFLKILALAIPLTILSEFFLSIIVGYEKISTYSLIHKVSTGFFKVLFIFLFISLGLGVSSIYFSYIFALLLTLVFAVFVCVFHFPYLFKKIFLKPTSKRSSLFRKMFAYSWPLFFYEFAWQIFHWTDSFILGIFKSATDVGIYGSGIQTAFLLTISSNLFIQLFFPMINRENSLKNKKIVKQLSQQVGKWIFFINLPVIILLLLFPEFFLNILFGNEFLLAKNSLRLLSVGLFFFSIFDVSDKIIAMAGRSKLIFVDLLVAIGINLFLNILLVPEYGILGAAFATALSLIVLSMIFVFQSFSLFKIIPVRRKMFNLLLAGLLATSFLLFFTKIISQTIFSLTMVFVTFLLLYIIFSFLFKAFDRNDFMILKSVYTKIRDLFRVYSFQKFLNKSS